MRAAGAGTGARDKPITCSSSKSFCSTPKPLIGFSVTLAWHSLMSMVVELVWNTVSEERTMMSETEEAVIKSLRSQSNDAIASHDVDCFIRMFAEEAKIIASTGELIDGVASTKQFFERAFADPSFVYARRTPTRVEVSGLTAAEEGEWEVLWTPNVVRGRYLARWNFIRDGWKVAGELYIPLSSA